MTIQDWTCFLFIRTSCSIWIVDSIATGSHLRYCGLSWNTLFPQTMGFEKWINQCDLDEWHEHVTYSCGGCRQLYCEQNTVPSLYLFLLSPAFSFLMIYGTESPIDRHNKILCLHHLVLAKDHDQILQLRVMWGTTRAIFLQGIDCTCQNGRRTSRRW